MVVPALGTQLSLLDSTLGVPLAPRARAHARGAGFARAPGAHARRDGAGAAVPFRSTAQPELPLVSTADARLDDEQARAVLERRLRHAIGHGAVTLTVTDNRRTMVSIRRDGDLRQVRLHHMFLDAPPEIVIALGRYFARGDRFASKLIDRYIAAHQHRIRAPQPADGDARLEPLGSVYDLEDIQRRLSARYFAGDVQVPITWGRNGSSQRRRRSRRTIRMGTYLIDEQLIRIHPALDQEFVPRFFVEWVVYHEMLHHVVPMPVVNGRRVYHSSEFRARERLFDDYDRARAWEEAHLTRLISSRRSGPPVRALPF